MVPFEHLSRQSNGLFKCLAVFGCLASVSKRLHKSLCLGSGLEVSLSGTMVEVQSNLAYDFQGAKLTDIEICAEKEVIFVGAGAATKTDNGHVHILTTVKRSSPTAPVSSGVLEAGPLPDMILPNSACTKLAVGNEGEAIYKNGLTDPAGSAMIFESSDWSNVANVVKHTVTFDSYTDSQLIQNGVSLVKVSLEISFFLFN